MNEIDRAKDEVCRHAREMWQLGLVVASAGNVSLRVGNAIAITPTGVLYATMKSDDIVVVDLGSGNVIGSGAPSYELPMHLAIYRAKPDVDAIVHTHSPFVTTLSVLRRPLPPVIDEMMVHFGGTIEVADYAFTGTEEVGTNVVRALGDRAGAILANHGNVCVGRDLSEALQVAVVMEATARVYVQALQTGEPTPLPSDAIARGRAMYEKKKLQ